MARERHRAESRGGAALRLALSLLVPAAIVLVVHTTSGARSVTAALGEDVATPALALPERRPARAAGAPATAGAVRPTGRLLALGGHGPRTGPGRLVRYSVQVEEGLPVAPGAFAGAVADVLADPRGWTSSGAVAFQRVPLRAAGVRVTLASPRLTDRLCAPLATRGRTSCETDGRVVLNFWRWTHGAPAYVHLARYRAYVVNHEIGHALGHAHAACSGAGMLAPVMMQQTLGVAPCRPNPWPLPGER